MEEAVSDADLLQRVAEGDRQAFETLYNRHSAKTFKFLVRLTGNQASAEDLTHDVFLEVWNSAKRFEGRSSPATWILSIARYRALDVRRKQRDLTEDDLPQRREATPEQVTMRSSSNEYIQECLKSLSLEHREIIDLVYFHEKSVKEIADLLDIPEATVKTRMFYARKKLRETMLARGDQTDVFSYGK
jgi:RNA polymerase sigma-70 factor (ECF subfamily)